MSTRSSALADRLLQGAESLARVAETLDDQQWATPIPGDGRPVGVVVHHVAAVYPIEVQLAQQLASGRPIEGVSWDDIHAMNAQHASDHAGVVAAEVRKLSDDELDAAACVCLNGDAPLTAQFFIEAHALSHSFHHLSRIRAALA